MTPMPPGVASVVDADSFQKRIAMRRDNSHDKPEECQVCSFETEDLKAFECDPGATVPATTHNWRCTLCANTLTGLLNDYPYVYP